MKLKPLSLIFSVCMAALLCSGCMPDDELILDSELMQEGSETTAETDSGMPDITSMLNALTGTSYPVTAPFTERGTVPATGDTTAADETAATTDSGSSAAQTQTETTASSERSTAQTAEAETTSAAVTVPTGPLRYTLSGIAAARLEIAENPLQYCREENGSTVFELKDALSAAGLRSNGDAFTSADGSASLQTGALLEEGFYTGIAVEQSVLQEIRYTVNGRTSILDQRAPTKAVYALPDGTLVTKDQIMLLCYLGEALGKTPESDPLADIIPSYFSEERAGNVYYYLP